MGIRAAFFWSMIRGRAGLQERREAIDGRIIDSLEAEGEKGSLIIWPTILRLFLHTAKLIAKHTAGWA
jgi:hypothetical protein